MGELAMREIDGAPVGEELHDRLLLPRQQPVDRMPARGPVRERACRGAFVPAPHPPAVELEHPADPGQGPARRHRVGDQVQQTHLYGLIDAGRDRAVQPQLVFPAGPPARSLAR